MRHQLLVGLLILLYGTGLLAAPSTLAVDEQTKLSFWPSKSKAEGGLLLVQGQDSHGHVLLETLAEILSNRGWSAAVVPSHLSSQKFEDQISACLATLRKQTKLKVGIVWYGGNYHQLLDYFSKPQSKQVSGLVLLSAFQHPSDGEKEPWQLRFPVLDIIAQFDYRLVTTGNTVRQTMFDKKEYVTRTIPGARHDYRYHEHYLSAAIDNWLTKLPSPKAGRVF